MVLNFCLRGWFQSSRIKYEVNLNCKRDYRALERQKRFSTIPEQVCLIFFNSLINCQRIFECNLNAITVNFIFSPLFFHFPGNIKIILRLFSTQNWHKDSFFDGVCYIKTQNQWMLCEFEAISMSKFKMWLRQ